MRGVDTRQNELSICPNLPEHWQAPAFQFIHQGVTYQFSLTQTSVTITADKDTQLLVQGALIPLTAERPKRSTLSIKERTTMTIGFIFLIWMVSLLTPPNFIIKLGKRWPIR